MYAGELWSWPINNGDKDTAYQASMPGQNATCRLQEYDDGKIRTLTYYVEDPEGTIEDPLHSGLKFRQYSVSKINLANNVQLTYNEEYFPITGYERYYTTVNTWQSGQKNDYTIKDKTEFSFYYTANEYPLDIYGLNGQKLGTYNLKYGVDFSAQLAEAQAKQEVVAGATFKGWFIDSARTEQYQGDNTMPMGLVLYADWNMPELTVTFHVNGQTTEKTVAYNDKVTSYVPKVEGYTFNGWYLSLIHI